jgi:magnesium-transporting ATPase (P-type)
MIFGWGAPLLAIHLLLVNVITDALPRPPPWAWSRRQGHMQHKPIPKDQGVFANGLGLMIALSGVMIGVLTLAAYYIGRFITVSPLYPASHAAGMTMAFLVLAISQLSNAMNCRGRSSLFRIGMTTNPAMLKAVAGSLALILLISFVPPLQAIFKLVTLSTAHWLWVIGLSVSPRVLCASVRAVAHAVRKEK